MIKISLICKLLFLYIIQLSGQYTAGTIVFEEKTNLHKNLPQEMEVMKERIPEFRTTDKILYFNNHASVYMNKPVDEAAQKQEFRGERGRGRWNRMRGEGVDDKYYTDFETDEALDQRTFFGKKFLIEGRRRNFDWKITGDQKQVGSYLCQRAVFQDSLTNIKVWFTPMISVTAGPQDFRGLPGLVLHVDVDDGLRVITALEIDLTPPDESLIVRPDEGKKMTFEEFETLREEKIEEMRAARGRGDGEGFRMRQGR